MRLREQALALLNRDDLDAPSELRLLGAVPMTDGWWFHGTTLHDAMRLVAGRPKPRARRFGDESMVAASLPGLYLTRGDLLAAWYAQDAQDDLEQRGASARAATPVVLALRLKPGLRWTPDEDDFDGEAADWADATRSLWNHAPLRKFMATPQPQRDRVQLQTWLQWAAQRLEPGTLFKLRVLAPMRVRLTKYIPARGQNEPLQLIGVVSPGRVARRRS